MKCKVDVNDFMPKAEELNLLTHAEGLQEDQKINIEPHDDSGLTAYLAPEVQP